MLRMQRFSKPTHSMGVTIAVPHESFTPTPLMSPLEIAASKGQEAKRLGHAPDNPYNDLPTPNEGGLAEAWDKGYNS